MLRFETNAVNKPRRDRNQSPPAATLVRVSGDTVFFLGAVALVLFVAGLKTGHSFRRTS